MFHHKILYIIGSLDIGGAEKHLTNIAVGLKKRGYTPEFFVLKAGGPLTPLLEAAHIPIISTKYRPWMDKLIPYRPARTALHLIFAFFALLKYLWKTTPPIVHFFLPIAYIVGGFASLLSPIRYRIMSRRSLNKYQLKNKSIKYFERFLHKHMTLITGNSQAVINELCQEKIPAEKLSLLYNGIDTKAYTLPFNRQEGRQQENIPDETIVLTLVANLIPYKGHQDLLTAFSLIKDQLQHPWLLLCAGRETPFLKELEHQTFQLGLEKNVRFLGSRSDVPALLRLSDIGLLCSHEEGFSNAILESMAAGLPMIVTNVGGNAEAVIDGVTGLVVPPHNPEALSKALLQLIQNPSQQKEMGKKGQERAQQEFDIAICLDHYESLYQECS